MLALIAPIKGTRTQRNVTVTDSAAVLLSAENKNIKTRAFQNAGSDTVYLGGSNVTASGTNRGYALFAGETVVDNGSFEAWYAIAGSGDSSVVHVMEIA